jgi:hypothetical protein
LNFLKLNLYCRQQILFLQQLKLTKSVFFKKKLLT